MAATISPVIPVNETPEFKAALAVAIAEAKSQAAAGSDITQLAESIATAITNLQYQANPRDKPVDPKILAERAVAMGRLGELLMQAKALPKGDARRPRYKARTKCNLSDRMIDPWKRDPATKRAVPIEFRWCGEPNDAMVPLNDLAKAIFAEFRASRGNKIEYTKEVQKQAWLSGNELVIEGFAPARREVQAEKDIDVDDLEVDLGDGPDDPNASHVRVLGTSHPPAKINANAEMI